MIECSNEFIYYKKKNRKINFKRFFRLLIIFLLVFGAIYYHKKVTVPHVINICMDKASAVNVKCVNNSILNSTASTSYSDLIEIEKNDKGEIVLISTNSQKINSLSRTVAESVREELIKELKKGIKIPWLSFSGVSFLSGYGKEVEFKVLNVEKVDCHLQSEFTSSGINQTLHSVYMEIESEIIIEFSASRESKTCLTNVLLTEAVLVGKVPEIYLNNNLLS